MPTYQAAWVATIAGPPIRRGWVTTCGGRVAATGGPETCPGGAVADLGEVVLLPALVNAHTHLELSWLRGRVPPAGSFVDWVSTMMRVRGTGAGEGQREAVKEALAEMRVSGTGVVGDISNDLESLDDLASSGLAGVVFHELIGFNTPDPRGLAARARRRIDAAAPGRDWRMALAPHAPYSVSPGLFDAVREARGPRPRMVSAVHVAEAGEEVEFVETGGGRWRRVLEANGAWDPAWQAPRCSPVAYLDRLGFWDDRTIAVHAVLARPEDLVTLRDRGTTVVTCPRSNAYVGAGAPPVEAFYASGVRVAVGTDSLASVSDLNVFAELAALRTAAPRVAAARLLASATADGAIALGLEAEFGTIEAGKRAALIAVSVPPGVADVEEYLVGGIAASQVQWIESGQPC
jgi:aminodeoxyfutalosine deaminase